jgi:drug/metabolite transporter (DMT)-like permease
MFLGESLCLIPYFYLRWRRQKRKRLDPAYVPRPHHEKRSRRIQRIMAFAVPTLADACGTTLMNVGLFFTYASIYQMLRGTLVLFAGMFTVIILRRQLHSHHWFGMVLITAGAAIVGASSVIYPPPGSSHGNHLGGVGAPAGMDSHATQGLAAFARHLLQHPQQQQQRLLADASILASSSGDLLNKVKEGAAAAAPLFGDVLVVLAQMFTALQFIMEEKYLVTYKVRGQASKGKVATRCCVCAERPLSSQVMTKGTGSSVTAKQLGRCSVLLSVYNVHGGAAMTFGMIMRLVWQLSCCQLVCLGASSAFVRPGSRYREPSPESLTTHHLTQSAPGLPHPLGARTVGRGPGGLLGPGSEPARAAHHHHGARP